MKSVAESKSKKKLIATHQTMPSLFDEPSLEKAPVSAPLVGARLALRIGKIPHVYRILLVGGAVSDCYVGSTTGKTDRSYFHAWQLKHGSHHSPRLQNAWNSYGADLFYYEILETTDIEQLRVSERRWMSELAVPKTTLPRFNCSEETDQPPHWTPSPKTRHIWSAQRKGRQHSAQTKAMIAIASTGRRHTPESLQKMRLVHAGRRPGTEARIRSRDVTHERFLERVESAKIWCAKLNIDGCVNGASLIYHIARCLEDRGLQIGEQIPSVGALAAALDLTPATVSMTLRRRAPVVNGLTITSTGAGLIVATAGGDQTSHPLSFYAMPTAMRISKIHRDRGVRPSQKCIDARFTRFARQKADAATDSAAPDNAKGDLCADDTNDRNRNDD